MFFAIHTQLCVGTSFLRIYQYVSCTAVSMFIDIPTQLSVCSTCVLHTWFINLLNDKDKGYQDKCRNKTKQLKSEENTHSEKLGNEIIRLNKEIREYAIFLQQLTWTQIPPNEFSLHEISILNFPTNIISTN